MADAICLPSTEHRPADSRLLGKPLERVSLPYPQAAEIPADDQRQIDHRIDWRRAGRIVHKVSPCLGHAAPLLPLSETDANCGAKIHVGQNTKKATGMAKGDRGVCP